MSVNFVETTDIGLLHLKNSLLIVIKNQIKQSKNVQCFSFKKNKDLVIFHVVYTKAVIHLNILKKSFSMSVGYLWDSIYQKEIFQMSVGFCGSL